MEQRMEEIDREMKCLEEQIQELKSRHIHLHCEKTSLFRANCKHEFVPAGYGLYEDGKMKDELMCKICGLRKFK